MGKKAQQPHNLTYSHHLHESGTLGEGMKQVRFGVQLTSQKQHLLQFSPFAKYYRFGIACSRKRQIVIPSRKFIK